MDMGSQPKSIACKFNPFWLTFFSKLEPVLTMFEEFIRLNRNSTLITVVWDTLKAFLRGLLFKEVSHVKGKSRQWESDL